MQKSFHSGHVKKSTVIKTPKDRVWREVSNIAGLPGWVIGVKSCRLKAGVRRGIGAVRDLTFDDGNRIEEHIVAWDSGESFSYIAVSGLPLRAYVATISLEKKSRGSTKITWQSYLNSKKMTKGEFTGFLAFMGAFYEGSLDNLRVILEKKKIKR